MFKLVFLDIKSTKFPSPRLLKIETPRFIRTIQPFLNFIAYGNL